ncbi:MAG: hypothetical protein GX573_16765 [Chloroflexi bacterium]|nr:hypothetical protein [Chloroflexota bacterium]
MTIQGGFGIKLKIDVTGTPTVVAHLLEMEYPEFEKILVESTAHDSPGGYAQYTATGKRRMGEFTATLAWDKTDPTHSAIQSAFDSLDPVAISVEDPDGGEPISFSAHIAKLGREAEQEGLYSCVVTIQPTGQPTIGS